MSINARLAVALVLVGGALVIGTALLSQYVGGLAPCELCLLERWPYYVGVPLALATLLVSGQRGALIGGCVLLLLVYLASAGLSFYHVGVEQHWFQGPTACTSGNISAKTLDQLRAQLLMQQTVLCDQPQWSFFGITLAGLNVLASLVLAALSAWGIRLAIEGRRA